MSHRVINPTITLSPSRMVKIHSFEGSRPTRALYIYLPPGYDDQPDVYYPVLYMHDGQNCFERFAADSFAGTWRADEVADQLILARQMAPCVIVGVSNGETQRMAEYLPPYSTFRIPKISDPTVKKRVGNPPSELCEGLADETFSYYRDEVAPFIAARYRVLTDRQHTATCGSSMGGLFSAYIAWEHPEFAWRHAALSSSFFTTRRADGQLEMVERFRQPPKRDIRLWLDSGTVGDQPGDDDNCADTQAARDALIANGYAADANFHYHLALGANHSEGAWAARLPLIFSFLFPPDRFE